MTRKPLLTAYLGPGFVVVALCVVLLIRALRRGPTFDFQIYWNAARAVGGEGSLYSGAAEWHEYYPYGPMFAILFRPLAMLSEVPAHIVWTVLSLLAVLVAAWLVRVSVTCWQGRQPSWWCSTLALLLVVESLANNFRYGNVNPIIFLLLALGLWALAKGRRFLAGMPLALAVTFKVTPLLFLVWLLLRRQWEAALGFVTGLVLFVAVVPGLYLGFEKAQEETLAWGQTVLFPLLHEGIDEGPKILQGSGQSLPRAAVVLLSERPALGPGEKPDRAPQLAALSKTTVQGVGYCLSALVILATLWFVRREPSFGFLGFGAVAAATLLASPVSRLGHFVHLYPLAVGLLVLAEGPPGRRRTLARRSLLAGVCLCILLYLAATLLQASSKTLFPVTGLTLPVWVGGLLVVANREEPGGLSPGESHAALAGPAR